ncbi:MAG: hypothetical protein COA79_02765 [Planctomycetota bacterium]|nr:MAG: hypothetical protein COA79_02765 [Planctomycetota bacterium]
MTVHFGRVQYPAKGEYRQNCQEHYQMFYIDSGSVELRMNGVLIPMVPDQGIIFKPGDHIKLNFNPLKPSQHSWVDFFDYSEEAWPRLKLLSEKDIFLISNQERSLLELLFGFDNYNTKKPDIFFTGLAELLLDLYLNKTNLRNELPVIIQKAQYYINQNFRKHIKAKDIALHFGISHEYLIRIFQNYLQISPAKYLWQKRVSEAQKLLMSTQLTLNDVSQQCGFQNPYHFSRKFKELTGLSPAHYKNN